MIELVREMPPPPEPGPPLELAPVVALLAAAEEDGSADERKSTGRDVWAASVESWARCRLVDELRSQYRQELRRALEAVGRRRDGRDRKRDGR